MTKKTNQQTQNKWYHERKWAALIVPLALLGAYGIASLAVDSGSLLQYFGAILLICLAVNRLAHIVLVSLRRRAV